jgi:hypothetical protein
LLAKNNQLSVIVCIGNLPNIVKTEKNGEFPLPLKKVNNLLSNISSIPIINESSSSTSSNATSPTNSPKREGSAKLTSRQRNTSTPTQSLSPEREKSRKVSRSTKERNKNKESSDKGDRNEKSEGRHENDNENSENISKEITNTTNEDHNNRNVIEDTEVQNEDADNNFENSTPSYTTTHYISNINNNNEEEVMGLIIRRPSQQRKILRNLERSQHNRKGSFASVGQDIQSGDASPLNQSSSDFSISSISSGSLFVDNTTTPTTTNSSSINKNNSNSNSLHIPPQQLRTSRSSLENISQDKPQSTPVAFSELFAQLDNGTMKKFEVDHEKETVSVTEYAINITISTSRTLVLLFYIFSFN